MMIDYIKLYSELQPDIDFTISLLLFLSLILIIIVEYFFRYYDEEQRGFIYIVSLVGIILISVGISYYIDKKREPVWKATALKYNVKNIDNLGKNIEILEKEFKFSVDKEEQINKTLNEFYKPAGIIIDKKIMEKLKN